jgi:hypothetical protein
MRRLFALLSTSISVFAAIGILLFSIQTAAQVKEKDITFTRPEQTPLVTRMDVPYKIQCGLANKHIAMWASHGKYFESKLNRWEWQRARLFETCEDLYTSSYVLPFLAPMLENAGAYVMMPRERDTQTEEVIVDNDGTLDQSAQYSEHNGTEAWATGSGAGFAQKRMMYQNFDNPFQEGTYRTVNTIKKGDESTAQWSPNIPRTGRYAVYISYRTLSNSTDDALYTVYHSGGITHFRVNQTMGGGTWIYLGTFLFDKGKNSTCRIELSNKSTKEDRVVTADAVKIGGGMGNIARRPSMEATENVKSSDANAKTQTADIPQVDYPYIPSNYPRFTEAARYWLQWAGAPDSIYSPTHGTNDYVDDYKCRGLWVNWLAGGSVVDPYDKGLGIPVDLSFALHTDAGTTLNDSIIGTLGIFYTNCYDSIYYNGASRHLAGELTDTVMSTITHDIRTLYEPRWTRRWMWDKPYFEARIPRVPAMLLELLSHENFADMRYGLDPRFRFTVSRAIYKGILKFISKQYDTKYVVQPLPVDHLALRLKAHNQVELTWKSVNDPLETTAAADKYIVYTRIGDGDFDNGTVIKKEKYTTKIASGKVISYKVTALNKGGESFPSETLSAGIADGGKDTVLVINGFDRISAPADFVAPAPADTALAGFLDDVDHGVPYIQDFSYIGKMKEFRRRIPWMDDDAAGFGDSYGNYERQVIGGNTFDCPALHGASILRAGHSFVSCSNEAIEDGNMAIGNYHIVDFILGKQCQTKMGRPGVTPLMFKTFTPAMQKILSAYTANGGNIFVTGAYVGTDLWDNHLVASKKEDRDFATTVLKYKWRTGQAALTGEVHSVPTPLNVTAGDFHYANTLNDSTYIVESPDAIEPADSSSFTIMRYTESELSAGVAYRGKYKTVVLGFPFESVASRSQRDAMMSEVLDFLKVKR